jgi:sugar lactone lactonase YvrE
MKYLSRAVSKLIAVASLGLAAITLPAQADFLVGNTLGNSVSRFDAVTGAYLGDFITAGSGGLTAPDALTFGPDGNWYVSSGTDASGQILRYNGQTGAFMGVFAQGGGLNRPYGSAFGPDGNLYVASFRSDEILRYNGQTGAFIDVFASGNGTAAGLLNGPNGLLFGADGSLYVTTEGSVADADGNVSFLYESQIVRYDLAAGTGQVFASQPAATPNGNGYVSLLGLAYGPDGLIYTSDYAGGIRSYDAGGNLVQTIDTGAIFGSHHLFGGGIPTTFGDFEFGADGALYASVFDDDGSGVSNNGVARCVIATGLCSAFITDNTHLSRPIGFALLQVPEPATWAMFGIGLLLLGATASRRQPLARAWQAAGAER